MWLFYGGSFRMRLHMASCSIWILCRRESKLNVPLLLKMFACAYAVIHLTDAMDFRTSSYMFTLFWKAASSIRSLFQSIWQWLVLVVKVIDFFFVLFFIVASDYWASSSIRPHSETPTNRSWVDRCLQHRLGDVRSLGLSLQEVWYCYKKTGCKVLTISCDYYACAG